MMVMYWVICVMWVLVTLSCNIVYVTLCTRKQFVLYALILQGDTAQKVMCGATGSFCGRHSAWGCVPTQAWPISRLENKSRKVGMPLAWLGLAWLGSVAKIAKISHLLFRLGSHQKIIYLHIEFYPFLVSFDLLTRRVYVLQLSGRSCIFLMENVLATKTDNQSFQVEQKAMRWHDCNKLEKWSLMELSPIVSLHWLQSYDVLGKRRPGQLNFLNVIQCHSLLPPFETKQLYVPPQMVNLSFIVWSPLWSVCLFVYR